MFVYSIKKCVVFVQVMLAALHAQVVKGECAGGGEECALAAGCVLPARLAQPALPAPAVRLHHLALRGTPPHLAMQRALTLASSWPLTRATIFDVMVSIHCFFRGANIIEIFLATPLGGPKGVARNVRLLIESKPWLSVVSLASLIVGYKLTLHFQL